MGILGSIELVKRTREVVVGLQSDGTPLTIKVHAPRLQLIPELRAAIPDPTPPPKRDENGRVKLRRTPKGELVKNASGQSIPELDHDDPGYLRDLTNAERARTIAMIFECAEFPGESAVEQNGHSPVEYQLARWKELEDAGVDVGAYRALSDAVVDLGRPMSKGEIEEAREVLGSDAKTQTEVKDRLREQGKKVPEGK